MSDHASKTTTGTGYRPAEDIARDLTPKTTAAFIEILRTELRALQVERVDLECRIRFMNSKLDKERKRLTLLRTLAAIYEDAETHG